MNIKDFTVVDQLLLETLIKKLNVLLSSYQVYYLNVRGYHWNIKGQDFFVLHEKFEEIYTDLQSKIDELAERIKSIGGTPAHSYSEYLIQSLVQEDVNVTSDKDCMKGLQKGLSDIIKHQYEVAHTASEAKDDVTNDLMIQYLSAQEKLMWMITAYLQ